MFGSTSLDRGPADAHEAAALWGVLRCAAVEAPGQAWHGVDCSSYSPGGGFQEISSGSSSSAAGDAAEGRLLRSARLLQSTVSHAPGPLRLSPQPRGSLSSLAAVPLPRTQPGPQEVLLSVRAVGLNFRDVLNVLGMYPGDPGEPGGDVAGIVAAVGSAVRHLHM
jgi:hypothetical protein